MSRTTKAAALAGAALASPLSAATPDLPSIIDRASVNGCELAVADAGKAMLVRASGLIPGESYRFALTNGDMKPVTFTGYANGQGEFIQYYVPFRFGLPGGIVGIRLVAANCTLGVSAAWTRGVPVR